MELDLSQSAVAIKSAVADFRGTNSQIKVHGFISLNGHKVSTPDFFKDALSQN